MRWKYFLPAAAIVGVGLAVGAIALDSQAPTPSPPAAAAPQPPYQSYVAGAGLIEATTGNIAIGTPVSGIVVKIAVNVGDHVEAQAPLFHIDDRALQAELLPASAKIQVAQAQLNKAKAELAIAERMEGTRAISKEELIERRAAVAIAEADLGFAKAEVARIKTEIDLHTIRAPLSGKVLQIETRLGEFAEARSLTTPLMIMGGDSRLNLRVDIDEYDAWRLRSDKPATAFVRGNPAVSFPLTFVRVEPFLVPKTSLTGNSTERTDTRVLQVIYSFDAAEFPVYIGQQLDVYIEAHPAAATAPTGGS